MYYRKIFNHIKKYGWASFFNYIIYYYKNTYKALAKKVINILRVKKISKPDKILGKFGNRLSIESEEYVYQKFSEVNPKKNQANSYSLKDYKNVQINKMRLMIFSPKFFNNSDKFVENDLTVNVIGSAIDNGIQVEHFYGNQLANSPFVGEIERYKAFESALANFQPDVLAIDSNSSINHKTFNCENLLNLKKKYGFKVLMFVPDFDLRKINYWMNTLVDLAQYSRPSLSYLISNIPEEKLVCFPPCPYKEFDTYTKDSREIDIFYSGSDTRQRRVFINAAYEAGLIVDSNFGNKESSLSPSYLDFMKKMRQSKMTFSNGYISKNNSLVAGRLIESMISRTVCLYEDCEDIQKFFEPYVHYVPVTNINNFVVQAQFLKKNKNYLEFLSDNAFDFLKENYSAKLFWNFVYVKLVQKGNL
jgi:hypothetical protein